MSNINNFYYGVPRVAANAVCNLLADNSMKIYFKCCVLQSDPKNIIGAGSCGSTDWWCWADHYRVSTEFLVWLDLFSQSTRYLRRAILMNLLYDKISFPQSTRYLMWWRLRELILDLFYDFFNKTKLYLFRPILA